MRPPLGLRLALTSVLAAGATLAPAVGDLPGDPGGVALAADLHAAWTAAAANGRWTVSVPRQTDGFSMVAVELPRAAEVTLRTARDGEWGPWTSLEAEPEDERPDDVTTTGASFTVPTWTGPSDAFQLSTDGSLVGVRVHLVDPGSPPGPRARANAAAAPRVVSRAEWGADEALRRPRKPEDLYAPVHAAIVHHTAGSNSYTDGAAVVRGIYRYHTQSRGWDDIGYNLLVGRDGTVYEGRWGGVDRGVVGAHASPYNTGTTGIALLGNFTDASPPTAMVNGLRDVLTWKYEVHGIDPAVDATTVLADTRIPRLNGHGDVNQTSCPGANVRRQLSGLRRDVAARVAAGWTPITGAWAPGLPESPGWFRDGEVRLRLGTSPNAEELAFRYGSRGDIPVVGDWDGDGVDTLAVVRGNTWYVRNSNSAGIAHRQFKFGRPGYEFFAGRWSATMVSDGPAARVGNTWYLKTLPAGDVADISFQYGRSGDPMLTGDWDGDGVDGPGVRIGNSTYLRDTNSTGVADRVVRYGAAGDVVRAGDWDGDGRSGIAVVRGTAWHLRNTFTDGPAEQTVVLRPTDPGDRWPG